MRSLQAKIVLVYLALAALLVGLSAVALIELDRIADKAREGSKVSELFDAALEMRRFEKNHLLYGQTRDLEDHAGYASRARELLQRDAEALDALAGRGTASGLRNDLARYTAAMAAHASTPNDETLANEVRALGNRIVTVGERLASQERQSLNAALAAHQRNLLVWLGVVAVLLVLTGVLLARQVTRPLQAMETRMDAVASGQLTRLALDSPEREFVSLAEAFNHVLDELERRQHTLVRAEKLASLGTLLSGVAHELNNPLSNISSSAQILKEDLPPPPSGEGPGEREQRLIRPPPSSASSSRTSTPKPCAPAASCAPCSTMPATGNSSARRCPSPNWWKKPCASSNPSAPPAWMCAWTSRRTWPSAVTARVCNRSCST